MEDIQSLPFAQQQRLRFIESMVLWEGTVQRQRVCEVFGINPNHVTRDIQVYKQHYPKNLEYNPSVRAYEPGVHFTPRLASGDPGEYLTLLHAYAESQSVAILPVLGSDGHLVETIPKAKYAVDQQVLRCVVQATRRGRGIQVVYNSLRSDKPRSGKLWPHAFVHTGLHWHIRAYDDLRREFRNFAIQRIDKVDLIDDTCPVSVEEDSAWHESLLIEVIPNPMFNAHQQRIIAREYCMTKVDHGWVWSENVRQCLVGYFAVHYRLDLEAAEVPQSRPLVLKDREKVRPYLFGVDPNGK
jgi:hypothetical protein